MTYARLFVVRKQGQSGQLVPWAPLERHAMRYVLERGLDESSKYVSNAATNQDRPVVAMCTVLGIEHPSHLHNWRKRGLLNAERADRMCDALGVHPTEVYGALWWQVWPLAKEDYGDRLLDFSWEPSSVRGKRLGLDRAKHARRRARQKECA